MVERTDEQLVAACRLGDRQAFADLVHRHTWRVYAVCFGALGDGTDSEDLTQETFIRSMTRIDTLRDDASFAGWIVQIARNLCRDFLRNRGRRRQLLADRPSPESPTEPDFDELHAALARLPEKHRLPLVLYYFDGESADRLARELEISEAGAHTRLSRARNALRALLAEKGGTS